MRTPVKGPRKRLLKTDSPSLPAGQAPDSVPSGSRFSPLVEKYLPFFLFPFFSHAPCIGSVESQVVDRQGSFSATIYDKTWNLPPPWAGLLHLVEERVVLKVSQRLFASRQPFPGRKRNA